MFVSPSVHHKNLRVKEESVSGNQSSSEAYSCTLFLNEWGTSTPRRGMLNKYEVNVRDQNVREILMVPVSGRRRGDGAETPSLSRNKWH